MLCMTYRDLNQVALVHKTNTFQGHAKLNCSAFQKNLQEHQQWKLWRIFNSPFLSQSTMLIFIEIMQCGVLKYDVVF